MKIVAWMALGLLVAVPLAFFIWLNVGYWSDLDTGTGLTILCSILDIFVFALAALGAVWCVGLVVEWALNEVGR